ncbi:hypothetical protein DN540_42735, partial [Burkholderia multivorans]
MISVSGMPMIMSAVTLVVGVGIVVVAAGSLAVTLVVAVREVTGVGAGLVVVRVLNCHVPRWGCGS